MNSPGPPDRTPAPRLVVPPSRRRERHRRVRRRLLVLLLAAVVGALVWIFGTADGSRWLEEMRQAGEAAPPPAAPPPDAASGAAPAEAPDSAVSLFRSRLRDVDQAVSSYFRRRRDFNRGRLDCEALVRGYAAVDDGNTELVLAQAAVRDRLTENDLEAYRELEAEVRSVDADFDRSGCPRPG